MNRSFASNWAEPPLPESPLPDCEPLWQPDGDPDESLPEDVPLLLDDPL